MNPTIKWNHPKTVLIICQLMIIPLGHAKDPTPSEITGQPGVDTAMAAAQSANTTATLTTPAGQPTPCTSALPAPALRTSVPECSKKVTRPTVVNISGVDEPACSHLSDAKYRQLVFLNTQALRLISRHARIVAARVSCLLGVQISEAEVTDSLAAMNDMLCTDSGQGYRSFIVNCSYEQGQSASFDPNRPYGSKRNEGEPDFSGAIEMNPGSLEKVAGESHNSDIGLVRANRQNVADTLVHENIHALTDYLAERFKDRGASSSSPPGVDGLSECSVGSMRGSIQLPECGPSFTRSYLRTSKIEALQLGNPSHDVGSYRPYPTSEAARGQIAAATAELARLAKLRKTPGTQADISMWTERKAEYERLLPCAIAFETNPGKYIRTDLDSRKNLWDPTCNERPSGRYRDEVNARFLAFVITGVGSESCEESDNHFFNQYPYPGGVRSAP